MKLKSARITNFRCVEDSQEFDIDQVTCLVGKNESGKTTILQALYRLNPWVSGELGFDKDRDYPRRYLHEYEERHGDDDADAVTTTWELDDEDIETVASILGPAAKALREVTVSKGYGENRFIRRKRAPGLKKADMLIPLGVA